jgi:ribonuclease HI
MQGRLDFGAPTASSSKKEAPMPKAALPVLHAYTDGACSGNPGPGGWGYVLKQAGKFLREGSGGAKRTTNNRMEMTAVIEMLNSLGAPHHVHITTDSQYVLKGFTEWLPGWQRRGWKNSQGKPVENRELWDALIIAAKPHKLEWHWVRGHNGHPENERADELAVAATPKG